MLCVCNLCVYTSPPCRRRRICTSMSCFITQSHYQLLAWHAYSQRLSCLQSHVRHDCYTDNIVIWTRKFSKMQRINNYVFSGSFSCKRGLWLSAMPQGLYCSLCTVSQPLPEVIYWTNSKPSGSYTSFTHPNTVYRHMAQVEIYNIYSFLGNEKNHNRYHCMK